MMSKSKSEIMHDAALKVLENYQATGEPFALFLSSWAIDDAKEIISHILGETKRDIQVRIGVERQVRVVLKYLTNLETVAVYRQNDSNRIGVPEEWPSFSLSDNEWLEKVKDLAALADLIVVHLGVTTTGIIEELNICSTEANILKTVLITQRTAEEIWQHQYSNLFPRIVPINELPPFFPLHPEFDPLIHRMKHIAELDSNIRKKYISPEVRVQKFPMPPVSGRFENSDS
jgi:hypothetical protein